MPKGAAEKKLFFKSWNNFLWEKQNGIQGAIFPIVTKLIKMFLNIKNGIY